MIKSRDYYEYETDSDCPPTPEQHDYSGIEDESSQAHLLNVPEYANTALQHYNSQDEHKVKVFFNRLCFQSISI
jgi:hypothetical protein